MNTQAILMAALLAGVKSTATPTSSPTLETQYIGDGFCLDCSNNMYSIVKGHFYNGEDCASWCLQHPTSLIGFVEEPNPQGVPGLTFCFCLFEGGTLPIIPVPDYNPPQFPEQTRSFPGTGPITVVRYLSNRPTSKCYIFKNVSQEMSRIYSAVLPSHSINMLFINLKRATTFCPTESPTSESATSHSPVTTGKYS